jgi:hypothetical protein
MKAYSLQGACTVLMTVAFTQSACVVVSSRRTDVSAPNRSGVSYYLPKKDVLVSMTIATGAAPALSIGTTSAYPDLSQRFVARYHQTFIGDDTLNIGVTTNGLLTSTNADFTSQLPTILKNVAKSVGALEMQEAKPLPDGCKCKSPGVYSTILKIDGEGIVDDGNLCGVPIKVERIGGTRPKASLSDSCRAPEDKLYRRQGFRGFFYRQQEAYLVEFPGDPRCGLPSQSGLAFSPNAAPLELLPVERGLFANATASFVFSEGSPTSYQQAKKSELAAISALPADLATEYFTAVGSMFQLRNTAATNEMNYEKTIASLLLQQQKTEACLAAIQAADQVAIDANCK